MTGPDDARAGRRCRPHRLRRAGCSARAGHGADRSARSPGPAPSGPAGNDRRRPGGARRSDRDRSRSGDRGGARSGGLRAAECGSADALGLVAVTFAVPRGWSVDRALSRLRRIAPGGAFAANVLHEPSGDAAAIDARSDRPRRRGRRRRHSRGDRRRCRGPSGAARLGPSAGFRRRSAASQRPWHRGRVADRRPGSGARRGAGHAAARRRHFRPRSHRRQCHGADPRARLACPATGCGWWRSAWSARPTRSSSASSPRRRRAACISSPRSAMTAAPRRRPIRLPIRGDRRHRRRRARPRADRGGAGAPSRLCRAGRRHGGRGRAQPRRGPRHFLCRAARRRPAGAPISAARNPLAALDGEARRGRGVGRGIVCGDCRTAPQAR